MFLRLSSTGCRIQSICHNTSVTFPISSDESQNSFIGKRKVAESFLGEHTKWGFTFDLVCLFCQEMIFYGFTRYLFYVVFLCVHPPFCRVPVQTCFSIFERADFQPAVLSVALKKYFLPFQMRGVPPFQDKAIEFGMVVESRDVPLKSCFSFSMRRGVSALRLAARGL